MPSHSTDYGVTASRSAVAAIEWPTVALAAVIYGGWGLLTWNYAVLPWWLVLPLGSWLIAWHMSLQHEVLHGHPTRNQHLNDALGFVPLALWLPYAVYQDSHQRHHRNEHLTDPIEDPESYYLSPRQAARLRAALPRTYRLTDTLLGRVLLGPARGMLVFLLGQLHAMVRGDRRLVRTWALHLVGVALLLIWIVGVCRIPLAGYLACFVYPGFGLALIRSFAEHRAADQVEHRTAIVENAPVLGLLFLYNNLHVVHHDHPGLPWYAIPACYRRHRAQLIARNDGLVYDGYMDVARRFLFSPHDELAHPGRTAGVA